MAFNPASLDTRKAAEDGVWFTLTDVSGSEIHEDGKPVQLQLYGKDSAIAKQALADMTGSGDDVATIAAMIKGWSKNLDAKSAEELAAIPHIAAWVVSKATNRANFMTKG